MPGLRDQDEKRAEVVTKNTGIELREGKNSRFLLSLPSQLGKTFSCAKERSKKANHLKQKKEKVRYCGCKGQSVRLSRNREGGGLLFTNWTYREKQTKKKGKSHRLDQMGCKYLS